MVAPPEAAAPPLAAAAPAADDPAADVAAALVAAALLLVDELVPDEQTASARPAAASPAMSFRLRARRTLFSSSSLHVTPVGGTVNLADWLIHDGHRRTLPAGKRAGRAPIPLRNRIVLHLARYVLLPHEKVFGRPVPTASPPFGRTSRGTFVADCHPVDRTDH